MPYFGKIPTCCAIGNKLELTEIDPKATRTFSRCCAGALGASRMITLINKRNLKRITRKFPLLRVLSAGYGSGPIFILLRTVLSIAQPQPDPPASLYRPTLFHQQYRVTTGA